MSCFVGLPLDDKSSEYPFEESLCEGIEGGVVGRFTGVG